MFGFLHHHPLTPWQDGDKRLGEETRRWLISVKFMLFKMSQAHDEDVGEVGADYLTWYIHSVPISVLGHHLKKV